MHVCRLASHDIKWNYVVMEISLDTSIQLFIFEVFSLNTTSIGIKLIAPKSFFLESVHHAEVTVTMCLFIFYYNILGSSPGIVVACWTTVSHLRERKELH